MFIAKHQALFTFLDLKRLLSYIQAMHTSGKQKL